jgi:hypothetical protein
MSTVSFANVRYDLEAHNRQQNNTECRNMESLFNFGTSCHEGQAVA